MKFEIAFELELNETDAALVVDMMEQDGIKLNDFAKNEISGKLLRLLITRKREIGSILAQDGAIDRQLRASSAEMAKARKVIW